jgi:LAO/AO transport system kinase
VSGLDSKEIVDGIRNGDTRALARAITLVENGDPASYDIVREVYPQTGRAHAVGITGPPGVGKSSLIAALVTRVRALGRTVGVISVDPSSPFTQGALLGDRIRLADHFLDPGVYIRSMGTRGHVGGLAEATLQALLLLDAFGEEVVFLETVGSGQSDVGVLSIADTIVLALQPGSGDSVQALKAGIMEIPDVIAVNKSDHPLARATVLTEALNGSGVDELWAAIEEHAAAGGLEERRRRNLATEVFAVASARAGRHLESAVTEDPELARLLEQVQRRELDPLTAVRTILREVFHLGDQNSPDTH